jgi:transcriptional regulator
LLTKKEKVILEFRKKGFKQIDIAKKLNISQPAVSAFEKNALGKIRSAKKILSFVKEIGFKYEEEE